MIVADTGAVVASGSLTELSSPQRNDWEPRPVATLDLRHIGAVTIDGQPKLLPRDA